MKTRTALGVAGVVALAVAVGVVAGLTLSDGPDDGEEATPTAAPDTTPTSTAVLAGASSTTTPAPTPTGTPEPAVSPSAVEYHLFQRVNFHRTSQGYDRVQLNDSLRAVARHHSEDMATEGYVGHRGSDGGTLPDRLERFGVDCRSSTETVGSAPFDSPVDAENGTTIRYDTAGEVAKVIVREWMNGDGTRSEILRFEWVDVGIGVHVVERTDGAVVYATQVLCEP